MHVINARNVNDALAKGVEYLKAEGEVQPSRNGSVLRAPCPVVTVYARPTERVLFNEMRDANPFFHLIEAIWMLAGRNDVALPARYAANMINYSDDGEMLHGAYGYRWRHAFGIDQLEEVISMLCHDRSTRRAVLAMWDPARHEDPDYAEDGYAGMNDLRLAVLGGKDVPCNTHIYFDTHGSKLNMTVCCRSNDAIWGAYGANAVHFSVLLEYIATAVRLPVGVYRQLSNDYHLYLGVPVAAAMLTEFFDRSCPYALAEWQGKEFTMPIVQHVARWDADAEDFLAALDENNAVDASLWKEPFFEHVATPIANAHRKYKLHTGDATAQRAYAMEELAHCKALDWYQACAAWIIRHTHGAANV